MKCKTPTPMNLYDLLHAADSLNITINAGQLIEAIDYCVHKTAQELERLRKPEPEQLISRYKAAEILDVDLSTLWRWNKEGYLLPVKIGGKRRYRMSDVQGLIDKKKHPVDNEPLSTKSIL